MKQFECIALTVLLRIFFQKHTLNILGCIQLKKHRLNTPICLKYLSPITDLSVGVLEEINTPCDLRFFKIGISICYVEKNDDMYSFDLEG